MDIQQAAGSGEVVDPLERAQARWSRVDMLLRTLATRLTHVADGRNPALDGTLVDLRLKLREPLAEENLRPLLDELTDAVRLLDFGITPASIAITPAAPTAIAAASAPLLALMGQLQLADADAAELEGVRVAITIANDAAALALQVDALIELINRDYRRLAAQRSAAQDLLTVVTRQLDELALYLDRDNADHRDGASARQTLNRDLSSEIDALGASVQSAPDVSSLQREIQARLGTITTHLKSFHEREDARARAWQSRSEQMDRRIHELERSAKTMETSLRQEHQLASTDPLTGVANRLVFGQRMTQVCQQVAQAEIQACLLVLDIDLFKDINDRFGHAAGDRALCIVTEQLQSALRPDDLLARYGGEEFVVVLAATDLQTAQQIAERLRSRIEATSFRCKRRPVRITLSCGVTALRDDDTPITAFERADRALYQAKQRGRNRCETL